MEEKQRKSLLEERKTEFAFFQVKQKLSMVSEVWIQKNASFDAKLTFFSTLLKIQQSVFLLTFGLTTGATAPASTRHDGQLQAASFGSGVGFCTVGALRFVTKVASMEGSCVFFRTCTVTGSFDDVGSTEVAATLDASVVSCTTTVVVGDCAFHTCTVTSTVNSQAIAAGSDFSRSTVTELGSLAASASDGVTFGTTSVASFCEGRTTCVGDCVAAFTVAVTERAEFGVFDATTSADTGTVTCSASPV